MNRSRPADAPTRLECKVRKGDGMTIKDDIRREAFREAYTSSWISAVLIGIIGCIVVLACDDKVVQPFAAGIAIMSCSRAVASAILIWSPPR